jgi:hypothetical protein
MLLINWTKDFSKTYWWPYFEGEWWGKLWYGEVRFLRIQLSLYSRKAGKLMLDKLGEEQP